jgi:hypothetical protein
MSNIRSTVYAMNARHRRQEIKAQEAADKPFKCSACNYRATTEEKIEKHARRQDKNYPFPKEIPNPHST